MGQQKDFQTSLYPRNVRGEEKKVWYYWHHVLNQLNFAFPISMTL